MKTRKRRWLIGLGIFAFLGALTLFVAAAILARHFEPYIREQAIQYLRTRFDSEVELTGLHVRMPNVSPLPLIFARGHGALAHVSGEGLLMRHYGRRDLPPMFSVKTFSFDVDLGELFGPRKVVPLVMVDGMEINVPPKGDRPDLSSRSAATDAAAPNPSLPRSAVVIETVLIRNANLAILPKDKTKVPLRFYISRLRLDSAGLNTAMRYHADLTNPKPPGDIHSIGTFGPWSADEPSNTPLTGDYTFNNADLGVFKAIAGILKSEGNFEGTLSSINAQGEASVPDFRLKRAGNPVSLVTHFRVLVDGTNGNTILKPVEAKLGNTHFTSSGGVIKHENDQPRTIRLDVSMPRGNLADLLRLAIKGEPFMEGQIFLKTSIDIPPLTGTVQEKLVLDGQFEVLNGKFLRSQVQDQLDSLSRKGQGQPKNQAIDEVVSLMGGKFKLDNQVITFQTLSFSVPGAAVDLAGSYDTDRDILDFHGTLKLQAKVSQTQTGWKRWVLKPVDPFFSKEGAGTLLHIKVDGSSKTPHFGLDKGKK